MKAFYSWRAKQKDGRLGQAFCNDFLREPYPELYYEVDDKKAEQMIKEWLTLHHYYATMPPKLKRKST